VQILDVLLELDGSWGDLNVRELLGEDDGGGSPLDWAAMNDSAAVVQRLLDFDEVDVDLECDDGTALHTAVLSGNIKTVRVLLAGGADKSIENYEGDTALSLAEKNGHSEVANILRTENDGTEVFLGP
jgi:ankyrin repeat protein